MIKTDTYLLININLINNFKQIEHFKLDLGNALTNEQNQFIPNDSIVQKHYMFFDQIITKCGSIGSLKIYSNFNVKNNTIEIYNEKEKSTYKLTGDHLYNDINKALDNFFTEHNLNKEIKPETTKEEKPKEEEYIKPDKNLEDMSLQERIEYARNIK